MKRITAIIAALALTSCAAHHPLVDMRGVDGNRYNSDLADCQQYAGQVAGAGTGAVIGGIASALLGFAVARAGGSGVYNAPATGRMAGVLGAAGGAAAGAQSEIQVVNRCMAGRGYMVLQ